MVSLYSGCAPGPQNKKAKSAVSNKGMPAMQYRFFKNAMPDGIFPALRRPPMTAPGKTPR
jgi:hypothetical protein